MTAAESLDYVKTLGTGKISLSGNVMRIAKFSGVGALVGGIVAWKTNNPIFIFAIIGGVAAGVASQYMQK